MSRASYPGNFFFLLVGVTVQSFLTVFFISVIYGFTKNIAGWSYDQAMIVVASFLLVEGLMWTTTAYLSGIRNNVRMGTMDYQLTKPVHIQFLISTWRIDVEDALRLVVAGYLFLVSLDRLNFSLLDNFWSLIFYALFILIAYLIIYSIALMINSISFWTIEGGSLQMIFENLVRTSQYPTDIFTNKIVKILFFSLMPLAFLATVPAKILLFGPRLDFLLIGLALSGSLLYLSSRFFIFGLKKYSSASN